MAFSVKVSEWAFRRLEAGQRALVMPEACLANYKYVEGVTLDDQIEFIEIGYEGRGTDCPVNTGRTLLLTIRHVTVAQPGMAGGYVLVEFINDL